MTRPSKSWFEVDRKGLAQVLARHGKGRAILELVSNAWDEDGVSEVWVTLLRLQGRTVRLIVKDDAPDGFADLRESFTLFAPSKKKADAEKRGRFNLGEKLALALCASAEIVSTKGGVRFSEKGRSRLRQKTAEGTCFSAYLSMTKAEFEEAVALIRRAISPPEIGTYLRIDDGEDYALRSGQLPNGTTVATLPTEVSDGEGALRPTRRQTEVRVYRTKGVVDDPHARPTSPAYLFELGIPVVEIPGPYSIDVRQRVPLTIDRANVRPAFLRELRAVVLSAMADDLSRGEASDDWVSDALGHPKTTPAAAKAVATSRFGPKRVVFDPSDQEANSRAAARGFTVVPGRALSRDAWEKIREAGAIEPAGRVFPTEKPRTSPDGKKIEIPRSDWTRAERSTVAAIDAVAAFLLREDVSRRLGVEVSKPVTTRIVDARGTTSSRFEAWFAQGGARPLAEPGPARSRVLREEPGRARRVGSPPRPARTRALLRGEPPLGRVRRGGVPDGREARAGRPEAASAPASRPDLGGGAVSPDEKIRVRAVLRVYNDELRAARKRAGLTMAELARRARTNVVRLYEMQRFAFRGHSPENWLLVAGRVAEVLDVPVQKLLPESMLGDEIPRLEAVALLGPRELGQLRDRATTEHFLGEASSPADYEAGRLPLDEALAALDERERDVVERRFGLSGSTPETLEEIATRYGVTRERVRQIEGRRSPGSAASGGPRRSRREAPRRLPGAPALRRRSSTAP